MVFPQEKVRILPQQLGLRKTQILHQEVYRPMNTPQYPQQVGHLLGTLEKKNITKKVVIALL